MKVGGCNEKISGIVGLLILAGMALLIVFPLVLFWKILFGFRKPSTELITETKNSPGWVITLLMLAVAYWLGTKNPTAGLADKWFSK